MKQIIAVRKDLNMRKGKMCAQSAHASVDICVEIMQGKNKVFKDDLALWLSEGMTKIVVGVNTEQELLDLYKKAQMTNLPTTLIKDAGRTEFKEPTFTVVGIGPAPDKTIDMITGDLKLL